MQIKSNYWNSPDRSAPPGHKARAQRLLHDGGELALLLELHLVPGRLPPLELPHHVGHEVLQVQHGDGQPGADPPPRPERHHPDPLGPRHVHARAVAALQEPLRRELHRPLPLPPVPAHLGHHEVHRRALGDQVPADVHVVRGLVRQHEVARRVLAQALEDHRLEVRHVMDGLLRDLLGVVAAGGPDLGVEALLDGRVLDQLGHDPLQPRGGGVGAGGEELGAERDDLVAGERAVALLGERDVQQGVHVRVLERGLARRRLAFLDLPLVLSPGVDQRREELHLAPSQGARGLEAPAEDVLGDGREEEEDAHLLGDVEQPGALGVLDGAHRGLAEPLAEAHEHEEAEHGVPERLHGVAGRAALARAQLVQEHAAHPGARGREQPDARRVQRLGDEVAAQEAPVGPVVGVGDDVAADAQERAGGGLGPVGDRDGAGAHERGVREAAVGHEDGEAGAHPERHHGAVPLEEPQQERLHVGGGVVQPQQVAEQRHGRRARREAAVPGVAAQDEEGEQEGAGEEEPAGLHGEAIFRDETKPLVVVLMMSWLGR
jgi:hypothetical protein